jgi:hypothetical protein
VKRSKREAALLERSTASLGQPLCKAEPGEVCYCEFKIGKVDQVKERACDPKRDANVLGVKQSRHVSEKGKSRASLLSVCKAKRVGLYSIK